MNRHALAAPLRIVLWLVVLFVLAVVMGLGVSQQDSHILAVGAVGLALACIIVAEGR